ncbi:MAG: MerR family transcriptional regulator [Rudaea sp.]|uniref:MerR family transcriptional regulator n=1 Tax=Rudaea sp. TaxID=2136325 RepID=UPI0039E3ED98
MKTYTVAQIARRTGVSVRTLHHYEAQGLLAPARRSDKGYRLYGAAELKRLQHVLALKTLGFSLTETRECLAADAPSFAAALRRQVVRLREAVARQSDLLVRLESVADAAGRGHAIDADTLLQSIEASTIMEKYLTQEQLAQVKQRGEDIGSVRIREVEQAWPEVIAGMQAALALGKDPASEEVQALARRWRSLLREFTGGDAGIQRSLNTMFEQEPQAMQQRTGIDPKMMAYVRQAIALLPAAD